MPALLTRISSRPWLRLDAFEQRRPFRLDTDVLTHGYDPLAAVARVDVGRINRRALFGEEVRRSPADAARGAGHDGDLAFEPHAASPANSMTNLGLLRLGETIA